MQPVSPLINDALTIVGSTGRAFLLDFRKQLADSSAGRWSSSRDPAFVGVGFRLLASRSGRTIVADATLALGVFLDETGPNGLLRVPVILPETVRMAIVGQRMDHIMDDPILQARARIITGLNHSADGQQLLFSYSAKPEPLIA